MKIRYAIVIMVGALALTAAALPAGNDGARSVPDDVQQLFDDGAAGWIAGDASGYGDEELAALREAKSVSDVHEIFGFSPEFLAGDRTKTPLRSIDEWIAVVHGGETVLGTATVWRPDGKKVEMAGYDGDIELGSALARVGTGIYVEDPRTAESFVVRGDTIEALNAQATVELPYPQKLADFQAVIAERIAASEAAGEGIDQPMGGGGPTADRRPWYYGFDPVVSLIALGLVIAGAALLITVFVRRRSASR